MTVENSVGIVTAVSPFIGYNKASEIAREAMSTGVSVKSIVLREGLLTEEKLAEILNPYAMTEWNQ